MTKPRRQFLRVAGAAAAGSLLLPQWACAPADSSATAVTGSEAPPMGDPSLEAFGIQLYTLREDMPKDPKGVLRQIADFGYPQIEGYEGPRGMFWDMGHTDFKKYLDELGLTMVSSHCNIYEDFETKAAQAAEIGMDYLICPYIGARKSKADWDKVIAQFNECGEICKQNGLRFAYHNHAYSFEEIDGIVPQAYIMDHTDPATVDFEMDIYWVVTAGADPIAWLNRYPGRWRLCHVKDRMKDAAPDEREASTDLGKGSIAYPEILKVAEANGMQYYILEQERYDGSTPLKSAKAGAEYLKRLEFA